MCRKLIFLVSLVSILGLVGSASAAVVELPDATLLQFGDSGWDTANTNVVVTDIAGDPGVKYNWTFGPSTAGIGWKAMGFALWNNGGLALTDTWSVTFHNNETYAYPVELDMLINGWLFTSAGWNWIQPNTTVTLTYAVPGGTTVINALAFEVGTSLGSGRPSGSPAFISIVPEPATIALLGLGGLLLRRRKH